MHQKFNAIASRRSKIDLEKLQKAIYQFLLNRVKTQPPKVVLQEFQSLFFEYRVHPGNAEVMKKLSDLIAANDRQCFLAVLKRCCYILINNWETQRQHDCVQQLIESFSPSQHYPKVASQVVNRLRKWLDIFRQSQDYQDLKIFANKYRKFKPAEMIENWSDRYTSYLLVPQYVNTSNPQEQREAARALSQKLKDQFKFDLAMYVARSQLGRTQARATENPTLLGDNVLNLIKIISLKNGTFNHRNLANIFLKQIQALKFHEFKQALCNYLLFSNRSATNSPQLKKRLSAAITAIYPERDEETIDNALLLRTCNRTIESLTVSTQQEPSELFIFLMLQSNPLTLAILLLKLVLICPHARTHLEMRAAELIRYYQHCPAETRQWAVNFFEVFQVVFAIFGDRDVQYNVLPRQRHRAPQNLERSSAKSYEIFSQYRGQSPQLMSNREETRSRSNAERQLPALNSARISLRAIDGPKFPIAASRAIENAV